MNQEYDAAARIPWRNSAKKPQDKPVLNAESFQRLLAAAYMLQVHNNREPSGSPVGTGHTSPFAVGAIVQKRTPPLRNPQLLAAQAHVAPFRALNGSVKSIGRPDHPRMLASPETAPVAPEIFLANESAKERLHPGRLAPPVEPTRPHRMNILLKKPMSWRTVEALAIAIVFCMMMGVSIHRHSDLSGGTSLPSGMLEQRNAPQLARASAFASPEQPVVTRYSRQSISQTEADIAAEKIVIRYQRNAFSHDPYMLAADTVVRYGDDVTMWSRNPKRAGLDRLRH